MKNLNNVEVCAVSGGGEIYFCQIIRKVDGKSVAKLLFTEDAYKKNFDIENAYKAIKKDFFGGKTSKDMTGGKYKFECNMDDV